MPNKVPPPDSPQHAQLLQALEARVQLSDRAILSKEEDWRRMEKGWRAVLDLTKTTKSRRNKATRKSDYPGTTPIIIPRAKAMGIAMASHLYGVFMHRDPVFEVEPGLPSARLSAKLYEQVLGYQSRRMNLSKRMWQACIDLLKYGVLGSSLTWLTRSAVRNVRRQETIYQDALDPLTGLIMAREPRQQLISSRERVVTYAGNWLEHVAPRDLIIDPRVPICESYRGEFTGRRYNRVLTQLKQEADDGMYDNVEWIRKETKRLEEGNLYPTDLLSRVFPQGRLSPPSGNNRDYKCDPDNPLIEEFIIDIIPSAYGFDGDQIERYLITRANRSVILSADPFDLPHGEFPILLAEYLPDGHSFIDEKNSYVEDLLPLQEHISFLVNSHMDDIRLGLNGRVVIDPLGINADDLLSADHGRIVRSRIPGRDVRTMIYERQAPNNTQGNMQDAAAFWNMLDQIGMISPNMQGQPNKGRRSARESQLVAESSSSILEVQAELLSAQYVTPLAEQMIQNIQGLQSEEMWIKVVGQQQLAELASMGAHVEGDLVNVRPEDILSEVRYRANDGTYPLGKMLRAQALQGLLPLVETIPTVNRAEIVKEVLNGYGVKNTDPFFLAPGELPPAVSVAQDTDVAEGIRKGDYVPMDEASGTPEAQGAFGPLGAQGNDPAQLLGMLLGGGSGGLA